MKKIELEKAIAGAYEQIYERYIERMTKANEARGAGEYIFESYEKDLAHGLWLSLTIMEIHMKIGCNGGAK